LEYGFLSVFIEISVSAAIADIWSLFDAIAHLPEKATDELLELSWVHRAEILGQPDLLNVFLVSSQSLFRELFFVKLTAKACPFSQCVAFGDAQLASIWFGYRS
jgi:hypothetical protein